MIVTCHWEEAMVVVSVSLSEHEMSVLLAETHLVVKLPWPNPVSPFEESETRDRKRLNLLFAKDPSDKFLPQDWSSAQ